MIVLLDTASAPTSGLVIIAKRHQLLRFLRPECPPFHARAVDLLWECNQLADPHALENVVATRLADPIKQLHAYNSFGVLWRLTGEPRAVTIADFIRGCDVARRAILHAHFDNRGRAEFTRSSTTSTSRDLDPTESQVILPSSRSLSWSTRRIKQRSRNNGIPPRHRVYHDPAW